MSYRTTLTWAPSTRGLVSAEDKATCASLRKSGGDFNLRQILQRDFHIAAFEFAVHHLVDVRFGIVHAYGFARKSEHVAMFGGDGGDPDVDVRQETKIVVCRPCR